MSDVVVDSSVIAKWVLPEPDSWEADRLVKDLQQRSDRMVLLDLAIIEVANAIRTRYHRGLATLDEAQGFLDSLLLTPVQVKEALPLIRPAFDIAKTYGCAVYDALFVALAQQLQLSGITADEPLWKAVKADYPQITLLRDWPASNP